MMGTPGLGTQVIEAPKEIRTRLTWMGFGVAVVLIVLGTWTMLKQIDAPAGTPSAAVEATWGEYQIMVKNLTSGGVLCVCGTVLMTFTVSKKCRAKTKQADKAYTKMEA